jgi:hypothetical protein
MPLLDEMLDGQEVICVAGHYPLSAHVAVVCAWNRWRIGSADAGDNSKPPAPREDMLTAAAPALARHCGNPFQSRFALSPWR